MVLRRPPDAGSLGTVVTFAQYIHVKRNNRARMMSELQATQQAIWGPFGASSSKTVLMPSHLRRDRHVLVDGDAAFIASEGE